MATSRMLLAAVLGWYWMVPPGFTEGPKRGLAETTAPLSRWGIFRAYDSASQCEQTRADVVLRARQAVASDPSDTTAAITLYATNLSECVSTDDPRLRP